MTIMKNRMILFAVGMLMACLLPQAALAQQEWQSTSTMQGSGSAYAPQVTAVGATAAPQQATTTTTESYSPAKTPGGPKRLPGGPTEPDQSQDSPLGDAVLPLLLMAAGFGLYTALRRWKETA